MKEGRSSMSFMNGLEVSRQFHREFIEHTLADHFPDLLYASALIGPGSEVLGFDTEMSTDHDWGPRVLLFLREEDLERKEQVMLCFEAHHPVMFLEYPVDLGRTVITTVRRYIENKLQYDMRKPLESMDWLTFPSQVLAEISNGAVFRDDIGELSEIRKRLAYYPDDVWLYLMASVWHRIGQEEHLMLRAGYAGDELGSAVIASRLVRDIMNLGFLMDRRYAPYPKWFGTAFRTLKFAGDLYPLLLAAQTSASWREREEALAEVYLQTARMHNKLGITLPVAEKITHFFDRPFKVIFGGRFAEALVIQIREEALKKLADKPLIGGIDQITDNTDFRSIHQWTKKPVLRNIYEQVLKV
jgi:hypothetical protein